jgi:hypothetical protein
MPHTLRAGNLVIYRKSKHSTRPGPRAREIRPAPGGEDYSYCVEKFWVITAVSPDGRVLARTRTGKVHFLVANDPALRKAKLWERLVYRRRFPTTA